MARKAKPVPVLLYVVFILAAALVVFGALVQERNVSTRVWCAEHGGELVVVDAGGQVCVLGQAP